MLISRSAAPLVVVLLLTPSITFSASPTDDPKPWDQHVTDGRSAAKEGQKIPARPWTNSRGCFDETGWPEYQIREDDYGRGRPRGQA
jgi:hypothetical protein